MVAIHPQMAIKKPQLRNGNSLAEDFYIESTRRGGANIPILWGTDAVHGHSNVLGATIFPHNIGLGATANEKLLKDIGSAVAEEVLQQEFIGLLLQQ